MFKHRPVYETFEHEGEKKLMYIKVEHDDNFLYRMTNSITISTKNLDKPPVAGEQLVIAEKNKGATLVQVRILIPATKTTKEVDVILAAYAQDIRDHRVVKTFYRESKYHYPVDLWKVLKGDPWWYRKLNPNWMSK